MKNTQMIPTLMGALLLSITAVNAEIKFMNSLQCAEKIPAAKELMVEGEKIQKTGMSQLKEIEQNAQKVLGEIQKERSDLMAKGATMNADAKYKEEKKIKDKERKVEEMQGEYQRVMHNIETEMQMVQMRLQPYIVEVIQNAQEVASKNPSTDAVWDNATKQFVYNKETLDVSPEVMKLTEKKNEQKTTLAKNKPAAAKPAATKVA